MFFHDWSGIVRTVLVGSLAYVTPVLFLNAFDLMVTVALSSTLSAIILQESVVLAEGAGALALLIFLQFTVTFWSVSSKRFAKVLRSEPTLLARDGAF